MMSAIQVPESAQNIGGKGFAIGMIEKRDQLPHIIQKKVKCKGNQFGIFKRASDGTSIMHSL